MKFQTGDKVLLLHTGEEGEVVEIIDHDMLTVKVKDVEFPVFQDQLEHPYYKIFSQLKSAAAPKKIHVDQLKPEPPVSDRDYGLDSGVWLCFLPVFDKEIVFEDVVDFFRVYIVNQTEFTYEFLYKYRFTHKTGLILRKKLEPGENLYLNNLSLEEMNDHPRFEFSIQLTQRDLRKVASYETVFRIKPKQLFEQIEQLRHEKKAWFSYLLMKRYPDDHEEFVKLSVPEESPFFDSGSKNESISAVRSVVDLHIEKITDDYLGMSNYEILSLQLKEFEKYYEAAVHHYQPVLTVIHGIGEGVLKKEIHQLLEGRDVVKSYSNDYHPAYGYGATEIRFQY